MSKTIKESYTTEFGQVIQPGDKVAVAVLSSKYINTYEGTYLGFVGEGKYKRVQVFTAGRFSWSKNKTRIATLWNNNIFLLESKNVNA